MKSGASGTSFSLLASQLSQQPMSSFGYRENLLSSFLDLSPMERARIFSISCIDPSHWEADPSWNMSLGELDELILDATGSLLDDYQYQSLERNGQLADVKNSFYHGDMINRFLCKYLGEELEFRCVPESNSGTGEFDVTILQEDLPLCEIGVKRMATSSQIVEYLQEHRGKVQSQGQGTHSVLCVFYPITSISDSKRVRELVFGYEYLSPYVDPFYESEENHIGMIPAPLEPDEEDIFPLEQVRDILLHELDLSR